MFSKLETDGGLAKTELDKIPDGEKIENAVLRFIIRSSAGILDYS
jgi:hypothetical protein